MASPETIPDLYEVLQQVRLRPVVFFGRPGTLPLLEAFLLGLMTQSHGQGQPAFSSFNAWLSARIESINDNHNMVGRWLERELGPEGAFKAYFDYLDEYRSNTLELLYANEGPFSPRFALGDGSAPPLPERLVVGRFAPSNVYFWGTQTGVAQDPLFPFCHSATKAKSLAAERWKVAPRSWKKLLRPETLYPRRSNGLWALLKQIRQRPGMYCEPAAKPLTALETFLSGYDAALSDHELSDEGRGFNEAFREYLLVRFGWSTCAGWALAIRDHLRRGEDELSKFFLLVDEFEAMVRVLPHDLHILQKHLQAVGAHRVQKRSLESLMKQLKERA